jgi:hypothetical protein
MRYLTINPYQRSCAEIDCKSFDEAMRSAGLVPQMVDHSRLSPEMAIVVYEYGLDENHQPHMMFFALSGLMYAGNALLYGVDRSGATVDVYAPREWINNELQWLGDAAAAEQAIAAGRVERPSIAVNGVIAWEWRYQRAAQ